MNKNKIIIKICGISDPEIASQAVEAGADLIGIVFHPPSPRFVSDLAIAKHIAEVTTDAGATPIAVFVHHNNVDMLNVCHTTNITTVQLHGAIARASHHLLPKHFKRIYVKSFQTVNEKEEGMDYLNLKRDYILIDNETPGSGRPFHWEKLKYDLPFRLLIAGGLCSQNVAHAINCLQPHGVDVSSQMESSIGKKDIKRIQQFIQTIRGVSHVTSKNV